MPEVTTRLKETWVVPIFHADADNHWVMLSTGYLRKGAVVRSLRLFTVEPTPALVEHQRSVLMEKLNTTRVDVDVFAVAPNFFEEGEAEIAGH